MVSMATSRLSDRRHRANGFTKLSTSILANHRRSSSKRRTCRSVPSLHSASSDDDVVNTISTRSSSRPGSAGSSRQSPSCGVPSVHSAPSDDRTFNSNRTSCNSRPRSAGALRPRSAGSSTRSTSCSGPSVHSASSDDRVFTNRTSCYSRPRSAGSSQSSPISPAGSSISVPPMQPIWSSDGSLRSHERSGRGWIASASRTRMDSDISCASSSRASSPRRLGDAWQIDSSRSSSSRSAANSSALKFQAREDFLKEIRSMQPSEIHRVLEDIRALQQSQPHDFSCICDALVRRISELIKRTPVQTLSQAGDMVKSVHESAMLQQSSSFLGEKLEAALIERLESQSARGHSFEACAERYEQASQLCAMSLVGTRCVEDAVDNLGHWLDCTPMMQLRRKVLQLAQLANGNEVIFGLLSQRFHKAAFLIASASSEELIYLAQAIIDFQGNGILVFGSEPLKQVLEYLENCVKTWPLQKLRQQFDPSINTGFKLFCEVSPLIHQSVCLALSKRLKRVLLTSLSSLQAKRDLTEREERLEVWHELANHGVSSGILAFSASTRDAAIRAFTDCLEAFMDRDDSDDDNRILLRMQAKVLDLMINSSERLLRKCATLIVEADS